MESGKGCQSKTKVVLERIRKKLTADLGFLILKTLGSWILALCGLEKMDLKHMDLG